MTRIGSVIATEIAPDDVRVHVANDRASLDLGAGVIVFPAERGPLDAQLRAAATPEPVATPDPDPYPASREAWIKDRLAVLAPIPEAVAHVGRTWPAGVAPKGPWTDSEVDAIDRCLAAAEAREARLLEAIEDYRQRLHKSERTLEEHAIATDGGDHSWRLRAKAEELGL